MNGKWYVNSVNCREILEKFLHTTIILMLRIYTYNAYFLFGFYEGFCILFFCLWLPETSTFYIIKFK